jgi:hypothetical protein
MRFNTFWIGGAVGGLLMLPLIGISYLTSELMGLAFAPFDLFDWMTRVLPGTVVTFGIDLMIDVIGVFGAGISDTAKTAERTIAILQLVAAGALFGAAYSSFSRNYDRRQATVSAAGIGGFAGFLMALISINIDGYSANVVFVILWSIASFANSSAWSQLAPRTLLCPRLAKFLGWQQALLVDGNS